MEMALMNTIHKLSYACCIRKFSPEVFQLGTCAEFTPTCCSFLRSNRDFPGTFPTGIESIQITGWTTNDFTFNLISIFIRRFFCRVISCSLCRLLNTSATFAAVFQHALFGMLSNLAHWQSKLYRKSNLLNSHFISLLLLYWRPLFFWAFVMIFLLRLNRILQRRRCLVTNPAMNVKRYTKPHNFYQLINHDPSRRLNSRFGRIWRWTIGIVKLSLYPISLRTSFLQSKVWKP